MTGAGGEIAYQPSCWHLLALLRLLDAVVAGRVAARGGSAGVAGRNRVSMRK